MWRGFGTAVAGATLLAAGFAPAAPAARGHSGSQGRAEPAGAVELVPLIRDQDRPPARRADGSGRPLALRRLPGRPSSPRRASCPGATSTPWGLRARLARATVLCLLNSERARHRLRPVVPDPRLTAAAGAHSTAMRDGHFFSHYGPDGGVRARIAATGYTRGARRWALGETLAWATGSLATPAALVRALMHSPPHRAIILSPAYRQAGVGLVVGVPAGGALGATLTVDFGRR